MNTIIHNMTPQEIDYVAGIASCLAQWCREHGEAFLSLQRLEELSDKLLYAEKEIQK